tara:strand:+ start:19500 stop:20027 length:528 start_codon:yes stop_codon:yes gene_type:complete
MLWELIATIVAGLGAAGIALAIRFISRKKAPRWLIPAFAGLGMLGFQIQSEYSWYQHQSGLLPEGVVVVRTVQQQAVWRPWSYLYPQTLRFIAADIANAAPNQRNNAVWLVDLYFFERRLAAKKVPQVVHCQQQARTDFTAKLTIPAPGEALNAAWHKLDNNDPLLLALCQRQAV